MAIQVLTPNNSANLAIANAVPDPKHIWLDSARRIVVYTGNDIPASLRATDFILNQTQFFNGVLTAGGQVMLNAVNAYIAERLGTDAAPGPATPSERIYWTTCNEIHRNHVFIRQLRLAIKGAKTETASRTGMDGAFIAGSVYDTQVSAG